MKNKLLMTLVMCLLSFAVNAADNCGTCKKVKDQPLQNALSCNATYIEEKLHQKIAKTEEKLQKLRQNLANEQQQGSQSGDSDDEFSDNGTYIARLEKQIRSKEKLLKDMNELLVAMQIVKMRISN